MKEEREREPENYAQQRKPKVATFDPFADRFKTSRRTDTFGDMFEEKIINDDF